MEGVLQISSMFTERYLVVINVDTRNYYRLLFFFRNYRNWSSSVDFFAKSFT